MNKLIKEIETIVLIMKLEKKIQNKLLKLDILIINNLCYYFYIYKPSYILRGVETEKMKFLFNEIKNKFY